MKNRNIGIDLLKLICSFCVVLIHMPSNNEFINSCTTFSRCAVPIFFMISGFLLKENKIKEYIKKIIYITLISSIIYFFWNIVLNLDTLGEYLKNVFNVKSFLKLLFFNDTSCFGFHLWYLYAYIYILVFHYYCMKLNFKNNSIYLIILFLLVVDFAFGKYSLLIWGKEFDYILVRNFLIVGIPNFYIGRFIKEYKENIKVKSNFLILFIIFFLITSFVERELLRINGFNTIREHYISTIFLSIITFLFFININVNDNYIRISEIGKKYSMLIYIIHPMVIDIYKFFIKKINFEIFNVFSALIIFIGTICIIKIMFFIKDTILNKGDKNCQESQDL